ncbi:MAG: ATP-dependent 6-phosphofructokinase, partial [Treponema sp.]|nr:ATP-dependent 6-phosphofructokinase [Treponema sp.]
MSEMLDFSIEELGKATIKSPIEMSKILGDKMANYVTDDKYIRQRIDVIPGAQAAIKKNQVLECAGPREMIYFMPAHVHAGIVSCGGLCPGINDVIRSVVRCLWYRYGVTRISGIRYG